MLKIILRYGIIGAIIGGIAFYVAGSLGSSLSVATAGLIGHMSIGIGICVVFFGIKAARKHLGNISFGKALLVGLGIAAIVGVGVAVADAIYLKANPDWLTEYSEKMMSEMQADGATAEEIVQAKEQQKGFETILEETPIVWYAMLWSETLFFGFILSIVCAFFLKGKDR